MSPIDDVEWLQAVAAVRRFVAKRGSAAVPPRAMAGGVAIGAWVGRQRERYWAAEMNPDQVDVLEQLPGWTWTGLAEQKWRRALTSLTGYAAAHGTAAVPVATVVGEIRLGAWVAAQRAGHEAGTLPPRNAELLEAVPGWQWEVHTDRWEEGLAAARTYAVQQATTDAPPQALVDGFRLGNWIQWARSAHRAGALSEEQVQQLEALPGWRWSLSMRRWNRGLTALLAFVAEHGSAAPPQATVVDGFPVGMWVFHRRREHVAGTLTPERVAVLEALPGWRWSRRPE